MEARCTKLENPKVKFALLLLTNISKLKILALLYNCGLNPGPFISQALKLALTCHLFPKWVVKLNLTFGASAPISTS